MLNLFIGYFWGIGNSKWTIASLPKVVVKGCSVSEGVAVASSTLNGSFLELATISFNIKSKFEQLERCYATVTSGCERRQALTCSPAPQLDSLSLNDRLNGSYV